VRASLRGADLTCTSILAADLDLACLSDACLDGVQLIDCHLRGGLVEGNLCKRMSAKGLTLAGCTLSGWRAELLAAESEVRLVHCKLRHREAWWQGSRDSKGERRVRSTGGPTIISGQIGTLVIERSRVHSLELQAPHCNVVLDNTEYVWMDVYQPQSVKVVNDDVRDHGGIICVHGHGAQVNAPGWRRIQGERGFVLALAPSRDLLDDGSWSDRYSELVDRAVLRVS
jgi:hypothetical protein